VEIYVQISIFSLFFLVFKHDYIRCVDLTRIAAHFVVKIDENLALMAVFNMI